MILFRGKFKSFLTSRLYIISLTWEDEKFEVILKDDLKNRLKTSRRYSGRLSETKKFMSEYLQTLLGNILTNSSENQR